MARSDVFCDVGCDALLVLVDNVEELKAFGDVIQIENGFPTSIMNRDSEMGLVLGISLDCEKIRKHFILRLPAIHIINRVPVADISNEAHTCRVEAPSTAARVTE